MQTDCRRFSHVRYSARQRTTSGLYQAEIGASRAKQLVDTGGISILLEAGTEVGGGCVGCEVSLELRKKPPYRHQ
jgi:hypothetical protein